MKHAVFSVEDEKVVLFCHGTEKRTNFVSMNSLGSESANNARVELLCNENEEFTLDGDIISVDKIHEATCTRIMEPLILREEESDCSSGLGADGRTEDLETIILAKVGWDFGNEFQEQVSTYLLFRYKAAFTMIDYIRGIFFLVFNLFR